MNNRIIVVLAVILITQISFSQKKSRGDRFFEKRDYINAALQYEEELNQEGYSKDILKNISTSYYNTFQFKEAYRYLRILTSGKFYEKDKTYENEYNFKMYQVLSALGKYERAIDFLEVYTKENEKPLVKSEAIKIIEEFKLKDDDYIIKSVGFNSEASEFGAIKRDSTVYFSTDRSPNGVMDKNYKWTHRPFLDIYKVVVDKENKPVSEIKEISKEINSSLHEGNFCFTADGNTLYLSRSNSQKGKKKYDSIGNNAVHLYKAIKKDGVWKKPVKLGFNQANYSIEHPTLNTDGTKLYFASNMPGGYGDFDLYYVTVDLDETYGTPINLGEVINTVNREQFPFIAKDGHLFFSSNGHLGLGMMDIFVSEVKEEKFTTPINLGAPINSGFDDFSLSYYNETDGFFASNRNKKSDNIYSFSQIGEIFPREYTARFEVKDYATDNYVPDASVLLIDKNKESVYKKKLDSIASFTLKILPGRYEFTASSDEYEAKSKPVLVKEKEEETYIIYLEKRKEDIVEDPSGNTVEKVAPPEKGKVANASTPTAEEIKARLLADKTGPPVIEKDGKLYFDLPPIYFDYDKWNIRVDSKKVLDDFALKLDKYKSVYINIGSHTDSRGTDSYNKVLSEKRAESTRNYLALEGYVNARRMKFEGFGESLPLIDCEGKTCDEDDHQTNRRSEFEIVKY